MVHHAEREEKNEKKSEKKSEKKLAVIKKKVSKREREKEEIPELLISNKHSTTDNICCPMYSHPARA